MNKKDILQSRALEIAQIPFTDDNSEYIEVLVFNLSNEQYAIETSFIEEVSIIKNMTEIPFTPDFIKGVINLRGHIYSIVDLLSFFRFEKLEKSSLVEKAIILRNETMEFGLLVYSLEGVKKIKRIDLLEVPVGISEKNQGYIISVTKENIIILDTEKLLSDEKMKIYQEI